MRTKAYDAYVHLRQKFIVPMQDGAALGSQENARTTKDLQNYPVDFHILPDCMTDASKCSGSGRYLNDDGEVLDLEDNVNLY